MIRIHSSATRFLESLSMQKPSASLSKSLCSLFFMSKQLLYSPMHLSASNAHFTHLFVTCMPLIISWLKPGAQSQFNWPFFGFEMTKIIWSPQAAKEIVIVNSIKFVFNLEFHAQSPSLLDIRGQVFPNGYSHVNSSRQLASSMQ